MSKRTMFYDGREYGDWKDAVAARPRYIYLIQCGAYVKIGVATEVEARLSELQIGNPAKLILIWKSSYFTRAQAYRIERRTHGLLASYRTSGEWFQVDPETARKAILKGYCS